MTTILEQAAEQYAKQFDFAEDSSPILDFIAGANWQKEQDEAKYKAILDSHNELLNELIEVCSDYSTNWDADEPKSSTAKTVVRLTNLINKAKNI